MARCDLPGNRLLYGLTLASGILECLCFSGVVFGYASLVFVLKEDGYFGHLCVSVPVTGDNLTAAVHIDCRRQDEQFSLVFTIASFLNNFVNLFNGYMFDRFGTMVTRLLAISVYTTGTLLLAFSSAAFSELLFPALSCIAVGGIVLLMTNMQMGNLFAAHRSTIITLCTGAYDSSASVFLVFKVLHQQGISLRSCLLVLSSCSVFHLVRTFLLMPRTLIPYPLPPHYTYGLSCGEANAYHVEKFEGPRERAAVVLHESGEKDDVPPAAEGETEAQGPGKAASFRSCLLSWFFLWHLVWLSIMQLRHYLFIGTLNPMLSRLAHGDPGLVSQYTNAFALTQLFGVLCGPLNGLIMDRHKGRPLAPGETAQEADLHSSSLSLLLTSLQCLLFSVCASIPLLPLQYLTFALQVLNRSFIYGGNAAFINVAFPACHFGKLYGAAMSLSAVFSLLQYPCFTLVKGPLGGDPFFVDIALIGVSLLGFIHPAHVFMHCRAAARRRENGDVIGDVIGDSTKL